MHAYVISMFGNRESREASPFCNHETSHSFVIYPARVRFIGVLFASSFYIYPLPPLDKPHFERYPTAKSCAVACCGNTPDCFLSFCCLSLTLFFFLSPPQCSSEIMRQTAPPLLQLLLPPLCILILATLPVASDDADFGEEEGAVVAETYTYRKLGKGECMDGNNE